MRYLLPIAVTLFTVAGLTAQWEPGSVYREYIWVTPEGGEAFLRVGGRFGYQAQPDKLPAELRDGYQLILPAEVDLRGAVRAEVTLEKVQSHENSTGLRIAVNGHPAIPVEEPDYIPEPQTEYMYHTDLTTPVPLNQLVAGGPIRFEMTLDTAQRWGWPQNVFYSIIFRIYYAPASAPKLAELPRLVPAKTYLTLDGADAGAKLKGVKAVDYVLVGHDVDWSGRGTQNRTHWQTHRGKPHHTLGHSTDAPSNFAVAWDTEWLPDQNEFGVQARTLSEDGKYRVSEVMGGLALAPRPHRIAIYESGPAPRNWVTRSGEFEQQITVTDSVKNATAFQLNWVSWSPCYANGLFLNDHLVWNSNEDCYVFATHEPIFENLEVKYLRTGPNKIHTGLTPLVGGGMVHGMEVQWPGVQLKVRY